MGGVGGNLHHSRPVRQIRGNTNILNQQIITSCSETPLFLALMTLLATELFLLWMVAAIVLEVMIWKRSIAKRSMLDQKKCGVSAADQSFDVGFLRNNGTTNEFESDYSTKIISFLKQSYILLANHVWPEMEFDWRIIVGTVIGFLAAAQVAFLFLCSL